MYWVLLPVDGQAAVGDSGLKLAGGPHWWPAMNKVSPAVPERPLPTWPLLPTPFFSAGALPFALPLAAGCAGAGGEREPADGEAAQLQE